MHAFSSDGSSLPGNNKLISMSVIRKAYESGTAVKKENITQDNEFAAARSILELNLKSVLCVPLRTKRAIRGFIYVHSRDNSPQFTEKNLLMLDTLVALANNILNFVSFTRKLRTTEQQLLAAERRSLVANLAGGISHEIMNALSPALGNAELITRKYMNSEIPLVKYGSERLEIITKQLNRIRKISEDLKNLSKPLEPSFCLFDLQALLEETLQLLSETAGKIKRFRRQEGARFVLLTHYQGNSLKIVGDPNQLQQVLFNTIINAIQAVEDMEGGTVEITLRDLPSKEVELIIADTGSGIAPENMDKIWEPYFTTKEEGRGTGLGMMIIKSAIRAHAGEIRIDSQLNHGTSVHITLPKYHQINSKGETTSPG
ncbi:MAG: GAF domain-containing protein [Pirellulales bacterium]|nr:GAF domain-containing protein [Pirellulales bacterium]